MSNNQDHNLHIVCLAGGVGGAKLAAGLAAALPPDQLTIIGNTGDDFRHLGLTICPDLDTVVYTLAGLANPQTGWGRTGESWRVMAEVAKLDGPEWFRLGDLDLATHLLRSHLLAEGESLTAVTQHLCRRWQVSVNILPMSDQPAPTLIETDEGTLPFQTWFVQRRWEPPVRRILLPEDVRTTAQVMSRLQQADLVILAPSNPFVSIDPILNVYPIRALLEDLPRAVVAVTPIIGGKAVKGPAAKMMREMGMAASATAVADYYGTLIDGFVYDKEDGSQDVATDIPTIAIDTMMRTPADRRRVAESVLHFAQQLGER